jgi:hypothetical protein
VIATAADGPVSTKTCEVVARRLPHGRFLRLDAPFTGVPWLSHPEDIGQIVVDFLAVQALIQLPELDEGT